MQTECFRTRKIEGKRVANSDVTAASKMPLRPDFKVWFGIIAEYVYHEAIRMRWPVRSDDYYCFQKSDDLVRIVEKLKEKKGGFPRECEAIEGSLNLLVKPLGKTPYYGEIVFIRNGKPFYILENLKVLSKANTICVSIDLDNLLKFACITIEDKEKKEKEEARWKLIGAGGVYVILCALATAMRGSF